MLNDMQIRTAKPKPGKSWKLSDGGGLYLLIQPTGGKLWRLDYSFAGKRKTLALGAYPAVGLKEAREGREAAKKALAGGIDPGALKQATKAAHRALAENSFEMVAREWWAKWKTGKSDRHVEVVLRRLETRVFPLIGNKPVASITAMEVLDLLRRIEAQGYGEVLAKTKSSISMVMRYAVATGRATHNPCPDLRGVFETKPVKHMAAPTDPEEAARLLRMMDSYRGTLVVQSALRLAPLLFCRPGELRTMRWADIDFSAAQWSYIVGKTKTPHAVALSRQAVAILREIEALTGGGEYVFQGRRSTKQPMSDNAVNAALKSLGISTQEELTGHGFRAMARTFLAERLGYEDRVIEHQLAHKVPDALGTAYNRTRFLDQRRKMMQEWADYLDRLKAGGAQVIQMSKAA
jgi:integrase